MHYLDNAATTRVLPEAAEAAVHAMCEEFGNPSSLHRMGLEASHLLENSRRTVASALGCLPEEVYFTACGTESTNISLRGAAHLNRHKKGRGGATCDDMLRLIELVQNRVREQFGVELECEVRIVK